MNKDFFRSYFYYILLKFSMITMIEKEKIKAETRALYDDSDIKTLRGLIFLTLCLKFLYTRQAIFIFSAIAPLCTAIYMYLNGFGIFILLSASLVHYLVYRITLAIAEKDGMREDYAEQVIVYQELKVILGEKKISGID